MIKKTDIPERNNVKLNVSPQEELAVLRKIVHLTHSELNLSVTLKEIVKIVSSITKADSVFIYLFDDKQKHLMLMASKTPHKKELGRVLLQVGEGITGWVARENKLVAITRNAYQDKRFKNFDVLPEDRYEAFLSMPMVVRQNVIGVINVQHKNSHEYAQTTKNLIELIAKQVGGALMNARMYDSMKNKALQFDSLNKVSQSVSSQNYLDEILDLIVVVTARMMDLKVCSIMLLDKSGHELVMKATQCLNPEYTQKPNLKVDESLIGEVIRSREPLVVRDVKTDERYRFPALARKENLCSMLSVPMLVKGQPIGLISLYTQQEYDFSEEDINLITIIANQAAVAVENTNLVAEAVKAREALETRKLIERAKGILMRMKSLDEDSAYRMIHRKAMDSCKPMKDVAESILLLADFQR
jgi:signal transduction protein with GAF and PtsI domain